MAKPWPQELCCKMVEIQEVLTHRGFWGKGKSAISEIRDKRGMFSTKTHEMGENGFQSPLFGHFAFENDENSQHL